MGLISGEIEHLKRENEQLRDLNKKLNVAMVEEWEMYQKSKEKIGSQMSEMNAKVQRLESIS